LLKKVKNVLGIEAKKDSFNQPWLWTWSLYTKNSVPSENEEKTVAVSACICAKGHYRHLNKETSDNCVSLETKKPRRDTRDTRDNLENDGIPSIESTVH
jgi:hypothetical protein